MAERSDDIQAQRSARAAELSGLDETAPADFTDIGTPPLFDTEGSVVEPQWSIVGVAPQRADIFEPVIDETIERWSARPRPAGFEKAYNNLDSVLDADLISAEGLTYSVPIGTWIGYYPGLSSNTQIGKGNSEFIVGRSATLTVFGISLAGTAYAPNYTIYGKDFAVGGAGTQFAGIITAVEYNGNSITVTATALNRTILEGDTPTQKWKLTPSGTMTEPNDIE